ncbi:Transport and Golgi organization protein 6-like protein [Acropora cervicornis]|uniref:Transport and Golgi organization protein 6-like protein n=1 Tax=Acropora cervicornis TaxID=6130 RepID=A0AAD9QF71_ACRCE|nr:Transport and Golgi organization protein 6-like protein [Acropora cervicornis]
MAGVGEVLSSLRILSSNSSSSNSARKKQDFHELLLSNMDRLRHALAETGSLLLLRERLEMVNARFGEEMADFVENKDVSSVNSKLTDKNDAGISKTKGARNAVKDAIRWSFVETCLELLVLLKNLLTSAKCESDRNDPESRHRKRGNDAPPLPADALGVGDQKAVLTVVQFVVILGICPNLLPGVGLPVERRSGFASVLNIHKGLKNERQLFKCVDTLIECTAQASLGSLVLSRHLGDILCGLLQICYAPVVAYAACNPLESGNSSNANNTCSAKVSSSQLRPVQACDRLGTQKPVEDKLKNYNFHPGDVHKLTESGGCDSNSDHGVFIAMSDREKCLSSLQRILDHVYQPIIVRELLLLLSCPIGASKQDNKGKTGDLRAASTPKWMRNVCGQLLSERLMKQNGVKAVLLGILGESKGAAASPDWQRCDAVAKVIAKCPSQATSVEDYYKMLSPQVLELLHGQGAGVGRSFIVAACSIVRHMLAQYPELAEKYVVHPILEPLTVTTESKEGGSGGVLMNELSVTRCVEDIHQVFVVGSRTSGLSFLSSILHPLFELFCFVLKGVSHLRSKLQEILVHVLKHSESHEALTVLYNLSFKQTPPQNFISAKDSASPNSDSNNFKEKNIQLNPMKDHFIFAHGDEGGVVIKLANNTANEGLEGAEFFRNIQGNTLKDSKVRAVCVVELLSVLKKDDIAGQFFIHLMQELTNIISDFSDDMGLEGIQQNLLILHLVALMCEKLGPSMLQNTTQTLAFIQATLKRTCAILQSDQEGLGTAFITETLTMSLGMLSAVLGGTLELKKEHRPLLQELLPSLATIAEDHSSTEIKDIANDLRIAIATHGAVWRNEDTSLKRAANPPQTASEFDVAFTELCDPFLPVRGHAIMKLASLLRQRDPKAMESTDTLLKIFLEQLSHDDSYIYLAAIKGLVSLADIRADVVIPRLAREFAICRMEASVGNAKKNGDKEKGCYVPSDKVPFRSMPPARSPELRMKLGEALVNATRNCGDMVPRFSQHLLPALLTGVKDPEPLIRASSLSNLGEVCQLLRFSLGPVVHEVLGSTLKEIYQLLKLVESTDNDHVARGHARIALGELDAVTREYLFPKPSLTKRIQVLP